MTIRTGFRIEELDREHIFEIAKTNPDARGLDREFLLKAFFTYKKAGNKSYTLIVDEKPVMSGGIFFIKGKWEAWIFISDLFYKHKVLCHWLLKKSFKSIITEMQLKRVQATIERKNHTPVNEKWIKSFGFELQGEYEDHFRYVREF